MACASVGLGSQLRKVGVGGEGGGLAHERSRGYKRAWVNKRGQERKAKYLEGQVWVGMWKRENARGRERV